MLGLLLVTGLNAYAEFGSAFSIHEHIKSASTLVRESFDEHGMTLDYAMKVMGKKLPLSVLSMFKKRGKTGKFLGAMVQADLGKKKGGEWTDEELDRAREILNKMYDQEQSDLDVTNVDCDKFERAVMDQLNENTRLRVILGEDTAKARADQLSATTTIKEARDQLRSLNEAYMEHQQACTSTLNAGRTQLAIMEFDYTVALKIKNMSACDDAQIEAAVAQDEDAGDASASAALIGTHVAFKECRMSDSEAEPTFAFAGLVQGQVGSFQSKAAKFAMQRMAKLALDRRLGKHHFRYALLQGRQDPTTTAAPVADISQVASGAEETVESGTPKELDPAGTKCNVNAVPNCPLLNDAVSQMVGEVKEALDEIRHHVDTTQFHCDEISNEYETQIADWEGTLDKSQIKLAEAIETINRNEEGSRQKLAEFESLSKELSDKQEECAVKIQALVDTMCGIKIVRLELYHMAQKEPIFQDCEVGDWVPAECSVKCGGGNQRLSRAITTPMDGGAACPPLTMEQPCNDYPCPIDCVMGDWSGWSTCSKDCGGGIAVRNRAVMTRMEHKGAACGPTDESRMCNNDACDKACELDDWSDWSSCNKACDTGIQSRRKGELVPALGSGECLHPDSGERFEERPCNELECPDNLVCKFKMDLVLLVDGSGSVRYRGFLQERLFTQSLIRRVTIGEDGAKVGVIKFSSQIDTVSQLTFDEAALETAVGSMSWPARSTSTSHGLSQALNLLAAGGRSDADSVVFVMTDGMPNDSDATAQMAAKVKLTARLVFVAVGRNLHMDSLYQWASFPPEQNVLTAKGFKELIKELPGFIADICPTMECSEDMTGAGADYMGCQATTVNGKQCQQWTSQYPHKHQWNPKLSSAARAALIGKNNFCRNPDGSETIWCYTTDPDTPREDCAPRTITSWS